MLFDILYFLIPAGIVIGVIEFLCEVFWWRFYFTFGIPVFVRIIPVTSETMRVLGADDIEEYGLPDKPRGLSIRAREVSKNCFGLKVVKGSRFVCTMHGFVLFDEVNRSITVKGLANWMALVWIAGSLFFLLLAATDGPDITFAAPPIIFIVVHLDAYSTQRKLFNELADTLQKLWSC